MLITLTHAYIHYWLANAIELCTRQTHKCVCVTPCTISRPSPIQQRRDVPSFYQPVVLVRTRDVQFTYFMGRVYLTEAKLHRWEVHTVINVFLEIFWDKRNRHLFKS